MNEEGEGDNLQTESSVLAKNPFDPPSPPGLPEIIDWSENHAELKWERPIRDGGSPITGYIIEALEKGTDDWKPVAEVAGHNVKGIAPKLTERQQYKFRVKAVNKAGPSEASEETNWHTAKPRNCESKSFT